MLNNLLDIPDEYMEEWISNLLSVIVDVVLLQCFMRFIDEIVDDIIRSFWGPLYSSSSIDFVLLVLKVVAGGGLNHVHFLQKVTDNFYVRFDF